MTIVFRYREEESGLIKKKELLYLRMNSMTRIKLIFVFVIVFALFVCVSSIAAAKTWYVDDDLADFPRANFTRIQDAVNAACEGDTILVYPGTYYESVNVTKQLILKGVDTSIGKPVVDADGNDSAITLGAEGITLEGFTATNAGSSWEHKDAGIRVITNHNTISGNNVSNTYYSVIRLDHSSNNKICLNNFINSTDNDYNTDNIWNSTSKITYTYNGSTYTNYLGNYWDDYKERFPAAEEINGYGLWNTPYSIDRDKGNYPLLNPSKHYFAASTEKQKGMSYAAWWYDTYATTDSDISLENLKDTCTEWVSLVVTWYQDNASSKGIYRDANRSPTDESLIHVINNIHSLNISVMLKPTVDLQDENWRGNIYFESEDEWATWFSNYEQFILHYADIAEQNNVEQFCVGVEYKKTVYRASEWRNIIDTVREHYAGPITYASNWDNYQNINWWDSLDFAGIDAYFPLTDKTDPRVEDLKEGWKNWANEIEAWQRTVNRQIIFTEIGYCSLDGTNIEPWNWTYFNIVDLQEQADCYNATYQTFWNKPWLAGIYWWMWGTDPDVGGPLDKSYTPYEKPVECIIKKYYCAEKACFDTDAPINPYPSIAGTHNGTIKPNQNIDVQKLYTYPCPGTSGHTEYARIWNSTLNATATWQGYQTDWRNITFNDSFTLVANKTYNYTIRTGSYPQIIHNQTFTTEYGTITCTEFTDANGNSYRARIPAINLFLQ